MSSFKHMPFDGSEPLFRIGLQMLALGDWIEVDDQLAFYLDEKDRLEAEWPRDIFVAETDTEAAQDEVLQMLVEHLPKTFPKSYKLSNDKSIMEIVPAGRQVSLTNKDRSPLQTASKLVQEDLIIMRQGEGKVKEGWRLAAASVCFPSSWNLRQKFSKPLDQIHAPVPGFGPATKNASMLDRVFTNLKTDLPVRRFNWSVYTDDQLFHTDREAENIKKEDLRAGAFLRIEHQTLRKLPISGDILFTVRIHLDPISKIKSHADCEKICAGFIDLLNLLNPDELAYKGLSNEVDNLIERLSKLGTNGANNGAVL